MEICEAKLVSAANTCPDQNSYQDYRCHCCGKLLFKAKTEPVGLEIRCPRCGKFINF